jgi:hypothetical protein
MKITRIRGHAVAVCCGSGHTFVLVDAKRPVHPGLGFFGLDGPDIGPCELKLGKLSVSTLPSSIIPLGVLPGDVLHVEGDRDAYVVGIVPGTNSLVLGDEKGLAVHKPVMGRIDFVTRRGFIGRKIEWEGREIWLDSGDLLYSCYGLKSGEKVIDCSTGELVEVLGVANERLWLKNDTKILCRCYTMDRFFRLYQLTTNRVLEVVVIDGVEFSCLPLDFFCVDCNVFLRIVGEVGVFYAGFGIEGKPRLVPKHECWVIHGNGRYFAGDRVICSNETGTLLEVADELGVFLSDNASVNGKPPVLIELGSLELISTIAGNGLVIIDGNEFNVSLFRGKSEDYLPCDVFVGKEGFYTVVGFHKQEVFVKCGNGDIIAFENRNECTLVRRYWRIGHYVRTIKRGGTFCFSVCVADMAGTNFLPGDGVLFQGGRECIVCGVFNGYIWLLDTEREFYCVQMADCGNEEIIKLVSRPTSRFGLFL